jgi:hypothetical protein
MLHPLQVVIFLAVPNGNGSHDVTRSTAPPFDVPMTVVNEELITQFDETAIARWITDAVRQTRLRNREIKSLSVPAVVMRYYPTEPINLTENPKWRAYVNKFNVRYHDFAQDEETIVAAIGDEPRRWIWSTKPPVTKPRTAARRATAPRDVKPPADGVIRYYPTD